jgi:hypothetical protein
MLDGQTIVIEDYLEIRPKGSRLLSHISLDGFIGSGTFSRMSFWSAKPLFAILEGDRVARLSPNNVGYIPGLWPH